MRRRPSIVLAHLALYAFQVEAEPEDAGDAFHARLLPQSSGFLQKAPVQSRQEYEEIIGLEGSSTIASCSCFEAVIFPERLLETRSLRRRPRDGAANAQDSSKSRRCPPCFRHNGTALGPLDSVSSIFQSLKRRTWLSKLESYENQTKHHFLSSWHPRYLQEKSRETERRRLLAFGCPSADLQAAMESSVTCTVEPVQRTDRGSYAGQTTSFGDFLVVGGCAPMGFLIYGALGSIAGMGVGALAIIALVLLCWPIAACKVLTRRCRRCCCRCCKEGPEIRPIGKFKKTTILLLSLIGVGGMAALPMGGLLGDLKAGSAGYDGADCAARSYLESALNSGGGSSASFIGFSVQSLSGETTSLASTAAQAATAGSSLSTAIQESVTLLRLILTSLQSQISVDGNTCDFCETCCGSQAGALVPQLLSTLEGGSLNSVPTLMSDFQEQTGSRITAFRNAVTGAGASITTVKEGIEADSTVEMLTMAFEFGAEGFSHFPNFLEPEEVQALQASVDAGPHDETLSTGRPLAATPGVHWHGFPRTHRAWQNGAQIASVPDVPQTCFSALHRLRSLGVIPAGYAFDQAIVNFYPEGCEGIRMHVDRANFDDIIVGFSLGAAVVMDLEPLDARERDEAADPTSETHAKHVLLEEGSVYIFSGHVRWKWKHGIKQGPHRYGDKELPVGERTSITFRRLRRPEQTESDELWKTQETKIGILCVFYSLHWCCCLRRCKIDRKDHPAPQWAACGWCGGCLGALLGAALAVSSFAAASVSEQMCIMFPGLGLDGTTSEAQTARSAFVACSSATATTRDLFPLLGLSAPTQGLSNVQTELNSVLSLDFAPILAEYQALNDQAVQAGPASSTGAYTCETWTNGAQAASSSCDWVTFKANYQTLVQQALQIGQTISTQLGVQKQSGSDWNSMNTKLQEVTGSQSLTRLQSGLNCEEVFNSWQIVQDQVCAGLADVHSTAGFGWMLAGALGFVGALGQYWIWRLLKDNRSLYLDEHDELRVRGWRRCVCCFCATSLGDLDDDAGLGKSEEEPKEQGSEPATPKKGGGKTSVASKRIVDGFFQDSATAIESNVRIFLADELFPTYDATFKNFAIGERVASWKALEKDKQSRGDTEVQPPGEAPTDPATLLAEYGDRGPDGVPIADASGEKLDKKTMAKLKKELALLQKPWDKWNNDKSKYEAYLLSKIRRRCLEQYAEVQYTEEVEHLRPLSPTSGLQVSSAPSNRSRTHRGTQNAQHGCGLGGVMRPSGGMNNWGAGLPQQAQRQDRQLLEETIRRHKAAQLARAAVDEDANRVKELLTERADPNVADTESRWPLTQAAFAGEACVVSLLLEARADPNLPQEGDRAIHVSAWQGDKAVTSLLLKSSADVEATDSNGCSPLCGAALKGHLAVVDLLLSHGADPARSVNVTGHGTLTPLKAAQDGRSAKVVEKLKDALAAVPPRARNSFSILSTPSPLVKTRVSLGVNSGGKTSGMSSPASVGSRSSVKKSMSSALTQCLAKCHGVCSCC
eukprot:symbB.v1.2.024187.t3/scaffold2225.1/size85319/8